MTRFAWTPEREQSLRNLYPHYTAQVVASVIGCSTTSAWAKAQRLGIGKSPEFLASLESGRIQRATRTPGMVDNQFKPGQHTWNKGLKGYKPGGRAAETQFKPGGKPHTTLPVGSYRLITCTQTGRKVLEHKFQEAPGNSVNRWAPVSRLVWEAAHGPVPQGHIVVFKPGMFTNVLEDITLDKLECITRAEHARRNHPRNKHPELGRLAQLKGAITRQVNRIVREHAEHQGATP